MCGLNSCGSESEYLRGSREENNEPW